MEDLKLLTPEELLVRKVKHYQKITIPPPEIAKMLEITTEQVCSILGYDPKNWENQHKDYCFFSHGMNHSEEDHIDLRFEIYAYFLQEGDFERYQPACYLSRDSKEFQELKAEAEAIPDSKDPVEQLRKLWILERFTVYQSKEWTDYQEKIIELRKQIPGLNELAEQVLQEWNNSRPISEIFKA